MLQHGRRVAGAAALGLAACGTLALGCSEAGPTSAPFSGPIGPGSLGGSGNDDPIDELPNTVDGPDRAFDVVDMGVADCAPLYASAKTVDDVASAEGARPAIRRLLPAYGGWLGESSYDSGFYRYSDDGLHVEPQRLQAGALDRLALVGDDIVVLSTDSDGVIWAPYTGTSLGSPAPLFDGNAFEIEVSPQGTKALAIWAGFDTVNAHLVDENGPEGELIPLLSGVITDSFRGAVTRTAGGFVVAFSTRRVSDSHFLTRTLSIDDDGNVGVIKVLYESLGRHDVVALTTTSEGASLLIADDGAPLLIPLDTQGAPTANAARYGDATKTYALDSVGGRTLLGARLADGRDAVRMLDENGRPLAGWQCLHATSSDGEHAVAFGHREASFAVMFRDEAGQNRFLELPASP